MENGASDLNGDLKTTGDSDVGGTSDQSQRFPLLHMNL